MVGSRTSCSAEEAQPPGHHARTSHLQSMCAAGPIRSMGPVSLLKVKPAAVTCVFLNRVDILSFVDLRSSRLRGIIAGHRNSLRTESLLGGCAVQAGRY